MSRETERSLIINTFKLNWNPADGPVAYPNHEFSTPENQMFAVVDIVEGVTFRASVGRAQYLKRVTGTLQVDIYTPLGLGTSKSRVIAERLERAFDTLDLVTSDGEPVIFGTPSSRSLPVNEMRAANLDDNWSRYVFQAPFRRDVTVTK